MQTKANCAYTTSPGGGPAARRTPRPEPRPPQRVSKPRKSGPTDAPRSRPRKSLPFRCIRDGAACKNPPTYARHKRNKSDGELRTNKARWRAGRFLRTRAVSRRNTSRNVRHPSPFTAGPTEAVLLAPLQRAIPIAQGRLAKAQTPVLAAGPTEAVLLPLPSNAPLGQQRLRRRHHAKRVPTLRQSTGSLSHEARHHSSPFLPPDRRRPSRSRRSNPEKRASSALLRA